MRRLLLIGIGTGWQHSSRLAVSVATCVGRDDGSRYLSLEWDVMVFRVWSLRNRYALSSAGIGLGPAFGM